MIGLQLLYGAVVYRAQHTIHHVLGDLSMAKQVSRELSTPLTPYTGNNLIEVISSSVGGFADDTDSNATEETGRSELDTPRVEPSCSENCPDDRTESKTNSVPEGSNSIVTVEPGNSDPNQKPSDSNSESNQTSNKPIKQSEESAENGANSGSNAEVSRLVPLTSQESVDTPTDSAEGGITTDETYSTDISEVFRAVYPELEELLSDEDTEGVFIDEPDGTADRNDDNNGLTEGENNQQFFIRFKFLHRKNHVIFSSNHSINTYLFLPFGPELRLDLEILDFQM